MVNPEWVSLDEARVYARNLEVRPAVASGRLGMARAYSVFATGGRDLSLRQDTLQALSAQRFHATVSLASVSDHWAS